jgi:hypothetical protein
MKSKRSEQRKRFAREEQYLDLTYLVKALL